MTGPTDPTPDIPPPPEGLPPWDDEEIVDQDELRPPLPPLETSPMAPMPDVPPGPESPVPPLSPLDSPSETPIGGNTEEGGPGV